VLAYSRYTLIDNTLLDFLDFLNSQNLGIVCAAAHAMGLLTNAGPPPWHPASNEQKELTQKARNLCKDRSVELGKLAMYYTMKLNEVSTFLTGMQTRQLLATNLTALYDGLNAKEQEVLQHLREK